MAWDLSCYRILSENLYPLNVNKALEDNDMKVYENMNVAIEFDISNAAIHKLSISMFQTQFPRTDNQGRRLLISCWELFAQLGHTGVSDQYDTSFQILWNSNHQMLVTRLITPWSYWYHHSDCKSQVRLNTINSINFETINVDIKKELYTWFTIGHDGKNCFPELIS